MTDIQLRGLVLKYLYDHRKTRNLNPHASDIGGGLDEDDLTRICDQLSEHGMVNMHAFNALKGTRIMTGCDISAKGIDVVETGISPDIRIDMPSQNINISGSTNVVVGNNNQQTILHSVQELVKAIETSPGTPEQKAEAKGLLKRALEHPMLAAVTGAAIGLLG